jgi:hypothetical protein
MTNDDPTTDNDLRNDIRLEQFRMQEYNALRAEGLRSAGIIANTVWLGTTQFAVTIGVAATSANKVHESVFNSNMLLLVFLTILSVESIAATAMFLSNLGKYVRVGCYIREEIETKYPVMHWEQWIQSKRSIAFPIVSIIILQFPFLASIAFLLAWKLDIDFLTDSHLNHNFQSLLVGINWTSILIFSLIGDLVAIFYKLWQIREDGKQSHNF